MTASVPAASAFDLSVVIVTFNAERFVGACLDALHRETAGLTVEVFVVDNGSTDTTVALLRERYPWVQLLETGLNHGFSAGNNLALPCCTGASVLLLNPDTVVQPGALRGLLVDLQAHPQTGAVGPRLRLGDGSTQPECARYLPTLRNLWPWLLLLDKLASRLPLTTFAQQANQNPLHNPPHHPPPPRWFDGFNLLRWRRDHSCAVQSLCGACMLLRREVIEQIGLLDEASPMYLDDIDYCRRLLDKGWQLRYVSSSEVTHFWQQSTQPRRAGDQFALVCHSIWLYLRKHEGPAAGRWFVVMALSAAAMRAPLALLGAMLPGVGQTNRQRRAHIALSMGRWALRHPKRPPRFGFAGEAADKQNSRSGLAPP